MSNLWEPKRRIERNFQKTLHEITDYMQEIIKGTTDPFEIVSKIKQMINNPIFARHAESAAVKMVTQIFADAGRTWREAAKYNSNGRTIYENLRKELSGPMGGAFYSQINRNAGIIKSLPLGVAQQVTQHVEKETIKGRRSEDIAHEIQTMFPGSSKAKANLIARTEVSKTSTALTRARSEDIGLAWYLWRTSEDQRVRKSHDHMEGVLVRWSDAPSPERLIGERSLGNYHAGEIFNCRCYPEPLVSLDVITWPHKVYYAGGIKSMTRSQFRQLTDGIQNTAVQITMPEPPKEEVKKVFAPAASVKDAESYSRTALKIPNVNLSDFDLQAANDINKHLSKLQEKYPEVFSMKKLSSCQTMYKDIYEKDVARLIEEFVKMGYNRSRAEELAAKHASRKKISSETIALSNGAKNEFNGISFNTKYYKTAKSYEELKAISKQQVDTGYWSHGGVNGTITHEFGHQVMNHLEDKHLSTPIHEVFKQFRQEVLDAKTGVQGYRDLLSEYGNTNVKEFFAEAFREYIESSSPRKYAKMIGEITENAFKALRRRR